MKKTLIVASKIVFVTLVLLIAICFENMIVRMSILLLMYTFISFLILKK